MNEIAFEDWYAANYRPLHAALLAAGADPAGTAEALDEACVRGYERWTRVGAMASPAGWVYTVARNAERRARHRRGREYAIAASQLARREHHGPDDAVALWDAVQRLDPQKREAVALRYILDLKERDVAEAMSLAPGTVARLLHDAREQLARALTADGVNP